MSNNASYQPFILEQDTSYTKNFCFTLKNIGTKTKLAIGLVALLIIALSITIPIVVSKDGAQKYAANNPFPPGIMISGGELEQSVELFDIYNQSHCLLPGLPHQIKYHSQDGTLICGGHSSLTKDSCHSFINGSWIRSDTKLQVKRVEHSSWSFSEGVLLIGGLYGKDNTEIVKPNGSTVLHYNLKHETRGACLIDEGGSYLLTGGQYTYDRVTRYDADGWLDDLTSLQQGRRMHGCSQFSDSDGKLRAIVAGGYDQSRQALSSSEMFDYSSNEWEVISSLPVAVFGLTGVTLNNKPVMIGGEGEDGSVLSEMFELSNGEWSLIGHMNVSRTYHALTTLDRDSLAFLWQFCLEDSSLI